MAKGPKVQSDESGSGSDSENEEESSKEDLIKMLQEAHSYIKKKREKCKELRKKCKSLEQSFDEQLATHEDLFYAHEELKKHHSSLLAQENESIVACNIGVTCDIIDESFYIHLLLLLPLSSLVVQTMLHLL